MAARSLGLSAAYLSDVLSGNRGISMRVAGKLGYRKVERRKVLYVRN
jgi:hypothetical protein